MTFRYTHPKLGPITATLTPKGIRVAPPAHQDYIAGELLTTLNQLPGGPELDSEGRAEQLAKSLKAKILERHPVAPKPFDPEAIY